jgi:ketosteroid isomerase-like protein
MNTDQNKQLVMQAYGLYAQGDIKGVLMLCDERICWVSPDIERVPFSGTYNGHYEVADFFSRMAEHLDTLQFAPRDVIAEGDKVVVTGDARWQVKATGVEFGTAWVHVFTVRDGKVVRFEQYSDTAAADTAFRAMPVKDVAEVELRH